MKNTGDGRRVQRVEKEIQSVLGMYLISGFNEPMDFFVTISRVIVSGDLKSAKIYITMIPKHSASDEIEAEDKNNEIVLNEDSQEDVIDLLNEHAHEFQKHISDQLQLRYVPKVKFFLDVSLDRVIKVEKILSELDKKKSN